MGIKSEHLKELGCTYHHSAILSDVYYLGTIKIHAYPGGEISEDYGDDGYDRVKPCHIFEPPDKENYWNQNVDICELHTPEEFAQWAKTFDLNKWRLEQQPILFRRKDKSASSGDSSYGGITRIGRMGSSVNPCGPAPWWNATIIELPNNLKKEKE